MDSRLNRHPGGKRWLACPNAGVEAAAKLNEGVEAAPNVLLNALELPLKAGVDAAPKLPKAGVLAGVPNAGVADPRAEALPCQAVRFPPVHFGDMPLGFTHTYF